jgi:hypothetical protein
MSARVLCSWLLLVAVIAAACSSSASTPTPQPSGTPGPPLTTAQLKLALIDRFGPRWYCDPDEFPIARGDEAKLSIQRFGEVKADADAYAAILARLGLAAAVEPTADQKLAIYRLWKVLNVTPLDSIGNGRYRFDYLAMPAAGASQGTRSGGIIDEQGAITVEQQAPAGQPPCPICLARGTGIATPAGEVPVEDVRVGMEVWSLDRNGRRLAVTVAKIGRTLVPPTHEVVRLELADGRSLDASPGHPLPDGRLLGEVRSGDTIDGTVVRSASLERYGGDFTFDLLPSGPTGIYFADGIPLASTLAPR